MYYQNYDLNYYIYQLQQQIQEQQLTIQRIQSSLASVQSEIKELKKKPSTTIEKIEYKFDQLKVETLEGTLNIGLNPYNADQIEDFDVKQGKLSVSGSNAFPPEVQSTIRNSMLEYLDVDAYQYIQELEKRTATSLNENYFDFMIQDVKRQLDTRIMYYLDQTVPEQWGNEQRTAETTAQIIERMKDDINNAFVAFVQHLPNDWKDGK